MIYFIFIRRTKSNVAGPQNSTVGCSYIEARVTAEDLEIQIQFIYRTEVKITDVCVPISKIADCIEETKLDLEQV